MSKGLEALQDLSKLVFIHGGVEQYKTIEKELEALEIIKEKGVNVHNFKEILIKQDWTYEQYLDEENDPNTSGHQFAYKLLTQEEFNLLKEQLYE